jgi:hypothetical protein
MLNQIMNNVSQQVMRGEKATQSKDLISSYIISLVLSACGRPFHPSVPSSVPSSIRPIIRPVIHSSKFLIPEEEDDGRGGGGMVAAAVYPSVYVIQSCSL